MNVQTARPGIYEDTRGKALAICGVYGRKCLVTYPSNLVCPHIPVWVVSTVRFRETMKLKKPFTVEDVKGYQDRITAHGPRRLCSKLERRLLFGAEGRAVRTTIFEEASRMAAPVQISPVSQVVTAKDGLTDPFAAQSWIRAAIQAALAKRHWLFGRTPITSPALTEA